MGSWPNQLRKALFLSNGTLLVVIVFALYYYTSFNLLHSPSKITDSANEVENTKTTEPNALPTSPYDSKKLAFLAETRPLPHLPALFAHMTAVIPPEWKFKFMGSEEAVAFMRSNPVIHRLESTGKLDIVPLPSNYSLSSRETISQMFTDPHLYRDLLAPAEHLLVFQPDSIFCANAPKTLNDFLEWDWIGAPWSKTAQYGGNGGLSLRKVSKIIQVLEKESRRHGDGALEDLWLSNRLRKLPDSRMAIANISKTFSVESVWDESPLGYHIGWLGVHHEQIWDQENQVKHVLEYCPEVKMILGMKLDNDKPATVQEIDRDKSKAAETTTVKKKDSERILVDPKLPDEKNGDREKDHKKLISHKISLAGENEKDPKDDKDKKLVSHKVTLLGEGGAKIGEEEKEVAPEIAAEDLTSVER